MSDEDRTRALLEEWKQRAGQEPLKAFAFGHYFRSQILSDADLRRLLALAAREGATVRITGESSLMLVHIAFSRKADELD